MNFSPSEVPSIVPAQRSTLIAALPQPIQDFFHKNEVASELFQREKPLRTEWILRHQFMIQEKTCIDERCLDAHVAKGLLVGLTEFFRSAGGMCDIGTLAYARRVLDGVRKARDIVVDGVPHPMAVLRFNTAHQSDSKHSTASCATWKHNTNKALRFMQRSADELNASFKGQVVALPLVLDTDRDANTFIGPCGNLSVNELVADPHMLNGSSHGYVMDRLRRIYPASWPPLERLDRVYREAFHEELAERVLANVAFVRGVIAQKRPIELLDHQGRYVFFGRHCDWITETNTVFVIDDTDSRTRVLSGFVIGMQYVTKNRLLDAIVNNDRDWIVPVIINTPHDDDDLSITVMYTRKRAQQLRQKLERSAEHIVEWLKHHLTADLPNWLRLTKVELINRVVFTTSVSHRTTRLFVPFR
jgi:hypothetical protein